ncbi:MAG: family 78 glycoside hydrolase catalytic domain, partial [Armatimonadota bacterium]|nr:family 78 glycoside hydrolase catalytic domain [Armatimonadota bacterium]
GHGGRINENLGFQEVYDASLRVPGWNLLDCREKDWHVASPVSLEGVLSPRPIPLLTESTLMPESVLGFFESPPRERDVPPSELHRIIASSPLCELTSGSVRNAEALFRKRGSMYVRTPRGGAGVAIILDFGREVFGNLELRISRCSRGYVDIAYSEVLEDGRVRPDRGGARYVDRIVLDKGPVEWQSFEPRAFRFVQLEFRELGRGAAVDYVRLNQISYPVRQTGSFECSDPVLNRIWKTAVYTAQLCMQDSFVASPAFDRRLNWADVCIQARAAYYVFGDTALLAKALRDAARTQAADGRLVGITSPEGREAADLMLLWVVSLLDYYAFSKDAALVQELYPCVRRLLKWFDRFRSGESLLVGVEGFLEARLSGLSSGTSGESAALNALYCHALRAAAVLARVCGCGADAENFESRANEIKLALNKLFYVPDRALYAGRRVGQKLVEEYGCLENVFAVVFDIADHYQKSAILRQVVGGAFADLETPLLASYVLQALYAREMHDAALSIIREKWGLLLEQDATTFGERFDGRSPRCRGWSVCPANDLIAEYAGIKPSLSPHRYSIVPHTADLKWARGAIETPGGPLAVEWRAKKTQLIIRVDVPTGVKADLYVPGEADSTVVCLNGKPQVSRFMTLDPGSHIVTVATARKSHRSKPNSAFELTPQSNVEVLGEVYDRCSRKRRVAKSGKPEAQRRSSRRQKTAHGSEDLHT